MVRVTPAHKGRHRPARMAIHHRQLCLVIISTASVGTTVALLNVMRVVIILSATFLAIVRVLRSVSRQIGAPSSIRGWWSISKLHVSLTWRRDWISSAAIKALGQGRRHLLVTTFLFATIDCATESQKGETDGEDQSSDNTYSNNKPLIVAW